MPQGRTLVTGASAGIGKALAEVFAREGHDVVIVARREDRLQRVADAIESAHGVESVAVPADLSDHAGREGLHDALESERIEFLVNNVGVGAQGHFLDIDLERDRTQLELNVATPMHLTKRLAPAMRERGHGGVLNVASSAAFQPGPFMAVYYASKSYLLSFSEALHEEFAADGVDVTALCPGMVATEFQDRAGNEHTPVGSPGGFPRWFDAETVAEAGYEGLMAGKPVVIPGAEYKALWRVARVLPRPVTRKLAKRFNRG